MEFIQNEIKELKKLLLENNLNTKEIFSVDDVIVYLQISKSYLYKLTSKRQIPFYTPGGKKIYFKRTEIDQWIYDSKVESISETQDDVERYISRAK